MRGAVSGRCMMDLWELWMSWIGSYVLGCFLTLGQAMLFPLNGQQQFDCADCSGHGGLDVAGGNLCAMGGLLIFPVL